MAVFTINNISIKGISVCVPAKVESNLDYDWISEEERNLLVKTIGVLHRHISTKESLASELCFTAAQQILKATATDVAEIGIIIFISQSKDYIVPSTAIILQHRLGLPETVMAFDVTLGCSGYVYGLNIISSLMKSAGAKKGLLLAGDSSTISLSKKDKSAYPLFGDGGSATIIEYKEGGKMDFNLQSSGNNHTAIIIPHGGAQHPIDAESNIEQEYEKGVVRSKKHLWLNGFDIFNFSVTEVPPNVKALLTYSNCGIDEIDYFVMHQANLLLNETIRKKLKFPVEKTPYSLKEYGNTSSASIPITIAANLADTLNHGKHKLLLSGFGVGLSWGSVILEVENLVIPPIIEL